MLAAIMICSLAVITTTSCSKDDDDDSGKASSLLGNWFVKINYIDDEEGEPIEGDYTEYILLNFGDGGVITRTIYSGNAGVPLMYWGRDVQSGTYTVNETAKTVTVKGLSYEEETSKYNISGDKLTLTTTYEYDYEEDDFSTTFHRPTTEDQDLISLLDSKAKEGMDMDGFDSSMREMDLLSLREGKPMDGEDITVKLKDGAAAAIYGARGANGVIFVTEGTK